MEKVCKRCEKTFTTEDKRAKYCCRDCYCPPLIRDCKRCGVQFRVRPSTNATYCSMKCARNTGVNAERLAEVRVCGACGREFSGHLNKFCSKECYYSRAAVMLDRECKTCKKLFKPRQVASPGNYCSNACKAKGHIVDKVKVNCFHCGAEKMVLPWRAARPSFYCTVKCQRLAVAEKINQRKWINGAAPSEYWQSKDWKVKAEKIRKRDKYKCQGCGISQEEFGATLAVHHKVPVRLNGSDKPSNLITLCKTCHITAENALWKHEFENYGGIRKQLRLPLR